MCYICRTPSKSAKWSVDTSKYSVDLSRVFRCVLAFLQGGVSVGPSVDPSVRRNENHCQSWTIECVYVCERERESERKRDGDTSSYPRACGDLFPNASFWTHPTMVRKCPKTTHWGSRPRVGQYICNRYVLRVIQSRPELHYQWVTKTIPKWFLHSGPFRII